MRDAFVGLLDKIDTALAESTGVFDEADLDVVARLARDMRVRLSYPESIVVAALAGGTGSGKSSLLNAVAGEEVALTGGLRPMTSVPLALMPAAVGQSLSGYLDTLDISERVEYQGPSWLCLIDLPDNDSVEVDHQHRVDEILLRVDVVIWVTDPEKYRDASLHHGYISGLAAYEEQFLFVLNQVDRMPEADVRAVLSDFDQALREDGIREPEVIATAADPVAGPPIGVEQLMQRLEKVAVRREAVHRKLLTDLSAATSQLVNTSSGAGGVDFEERWDAEMSKTVSLALEGNISDAGQDLGGFVEGLAEEVEGEIAVELREMAREVPAALVQCAVGADLGSPVPEKRFWLIRLIRRRSGDGGVVDGPGQRGSLKRAVDRDIGDPLRELLARRGRAHAAIADLSLALGDLERRTG